jgi:hypothetical protein
MKYILTQQDSTQLGAFTTVVESSDGYVCDGALCPTSIYGALTVSEVADDYMTPAQITAYNINISIAREQAYKSGSDPIFFQYQRGSKTEQEWLDAVNAIKAQLPYKE